MERPLGAAPWFTGMDCAAGVIKDAMPLNSPHLNGVAGLAPKSAGNLPPFHAQMLNHSFLVIFIERNGCVPLAAISALLADKYI